MTLSSNNLNKSLPENTTQLQLDTTATAETATTATASSFPDMQPKMTVRSKPCECAVCSIGKGISISDQLQLEEYSGMFWSYEKILAPPEQKSPPTSLNGQMKPKKTIRSKPCECADCSYGKPIVATATM